MSNKKDLFLRTKRLENFSGHVRLFLHLFQLHPVIPGRVMQSLRLRVER